MDGVLPGYTVDSTTWSYLSFLLIVAVYFRFTRVWSLRNLDLSLLLVLSPALLLVRYETAVAYPWLFTATGLIFLRLIADQYFTRRPLFPQNMNTAGLIWLGSATFTFLMAIVVTFSPSEPTLESVRRGQQLLHRSDNSDSQQQVDTGPATAIIAAPVGVISGAVAKSGADHPVTPEEQIELTARILVICAHLAIIAGLIYIGYRRFCDLHLGIAMAVLYLLLPCTAIHVGEINQVIPAALILWAVALYRRPAVSGGMIGFACGMVFFPIFLVPLWATFYGRKGARQFLGGWITVLTLVLMSLLLVSTDSTSFFRQTVSAISWSSLSFNPQDSDGFWSTFESAYRIPVIAVYLVIVASLTIWPLEKKLEHLIANSTALIVGTQFWYPQQGGIYVLWYLPLLLLVVFRPHLHHQNPPGYEQDSETVKRKTGRNSFQRKPAVPPIPSQTGAVSYAPFRQRDNNT
ncbi:hypothetical protein Pla110_30300 [Polystyrenella longa]|uniref:DUF2029 domain-containing protein n=1 Tax=Polystyrenella longa TaxID=2528007 RepID=A0A518CPZ3_9PLAN|nr:hypothetical protein [Polystyrenella longa]QDU81289.1 hypothetical protein Pla110_30300 [Polystyrenella longa]